MSDQSYYLKRVVPEHRKPKFLNWLEVNLNLVDESVQVLNDFERQFDLEHAVGDQLNILGDIVGRKRLLNFQPMYGLSSLLKDDIYRMIVKTKIGINHWDGTIPGMIELWQNLFPEYKITIQDNQNMTMKVYIEGYTPLLLRELVGRNYIVPKPEGVKLDYEFFQMLDLCNDLYVASVSTAELHYVIQNRLEEEYTSKQQSILSTAQDISVNYDLL